METLQQKQARFAKQVARLILKADELGYTVTFGETWRTPEQAALNVANGTGTKTSLHIERLAVDINLFIDGRYITNDEGHNTLGAWWTSLGPEYRWGGNFTKRDFNHYSLSSDGIRG